jgi:restriction system protein
MDFDTQLTPPSADGGRDIIAVSTVTGQRVQLLIECKRYQGKVGVVIVRALLGVVANERANKGVLVTTADFTRGARRLEVDDPRIELISGSQLVLLLNEYLGSTWPARMDYLTRERPVGAG